MKKLNMEKDMPHFEWSVAKSILRGKVRGELTIMYPDRLQL